MKEGEVSFKYREIPGILRAIVALFSVAGIAVVILFLFRINVAGRSFTENGYYFLLMALLLSPLFLYVAPSRGKGSFVKLPWYDVLAALLAFGIPFYLFLTSFQMSVKGWDVIAPTHVFIICLIEVILVLEAVRRSVGTIFAIICFFFLIFPLFASHMPSPFTGVDFIFLRIIPFQVMGSEGFLGIVMQVVGTLLVGFMVFATALMATGGGEFFLNIALAAFGHVRGGPAKVSVFASGLFGMISGSVTSNVLTVGSFTIPTMKRTGYPPHYAAAVEACASTGGVLMPPVMGAAAFLIAQFLHIPYAQVAIAAAVPSILYYLGLFMQADAYAARTGIKGLPKESLPSIKQTLKDGWFYIFAFFILVYLLLYLRREGQAPFYAIAALFVLAMIRKKTRLTPQRLMAFLENNARTLSELMAIMLAVGLIIGALSVTGVAHGFSAAVIELCGTNVPLLLILGALTSFILGMGMSVTACYIFLAVLLAPGLIHAGLDPLAVHLFILYWGMISFITPPVAVGAFVAAGLARANPMRTALQATRLGIVIYFMPFFFAVEPALILHGSPVMIIVSFVTAVIGVMFTAAGVEGYLVGIGVLKMWARPICAIAGLLMMYPDWLNTSIGVVIAALLISVLWIRKRSKLRVVESRN